MLLRHKTPTIFNIYMLDVICCALGCVILLWQVAHQEAESQTEKAKKESAASEYARIQTEKIGKDLLAKQLEYEESNRNLAAALGALERALGQKASLSQSLASAEKDRDAAKQLATDRQEDLAKARLLLNLSDERLKNLEANLLKRLSEQAKLFEQLKNAEQKNVEMTAQLVLANKSIAALNDDAAVKLADLKSAQKNAKEQAVLLKLSQEDARKLQNLLALANKNIDLMKGDIAGQLANLKSAQKTAQEQAALLKISQEDARRLQTLLDSLRMDSKSAQAKLKLTELTLKVREEDLDRTRKDLTLLLTTKDRLNQRIVSLEADLDQRFAGIPLTGENVVFLIDTSGSMMMKDGEVEDPDKWPFLCETLMKLMKSIPTLQRFQVILFSEKSKDKDGKLKGDPVVHLFQNRDQWLKYDGPKTALRVRDELKKVEPDGGTNLHAGFEDAFRYRKIKLDTIYLFSDGLPNVGPGVPANIGNPTEAQKNLLMAKFIRDKLKTDWNRPDNVKRDVRINAVGFYFESPDVGAFLWALAREHKGNFVGLR